MNRKQALIELAMLVLDMKKARDLYEDSGYLNAQERFEALSEKEEEVFDRAEALLAAANQPEEHPFHTFQRQLKEWAEEFFKPEAQRTGQVVLLEEALPAFRSVNKATTVQPFLKCLQSWAEGSGRSYVYGTFRVRGLVRRGVIIGAHGSNN